MKKIIGFVSFGMLFALLAFAAEPTLFNLPGSVFAEDGVGNPPGGGGTVVADKCCKRIFKNRPPSKTCYWFGACTNIHNNHPVVPKALCDGVTEFKGEAWDDKKDCVDLVTQKCDPVKTVLKDINVPVGTLDCLSGARIQQTNYCTCKFSPTGNGTVPAETCGEDECPAAVYPPVTNP